MADANAPHLHVEFYTEPVQNPAESAKQGRPIFEDKEFVRIRIVGDQKSSLVAPADAKSIRDPQTGQELTYAQRFPEHYRYFKDNQDQQAAAGTPLSEVMWITAARRAELKFFNVTTVEGLAGLDGAMLSRIGMDARELKTKAQVFLDKAAGSAVESRMASELAARDSQIEALTRQMADLMAQMNARNTPTAPPPAQEEDNAGPFADYSDEDIKNFIADRTGSRPKGNPNRDTLLRTAASLVAGDEQSEAA